VRHAQGIHNLSYSNHHLPDPHLTAFGEEQCRNLAAKFPYHDKIELILSSPLRRAIHTALLAFAPEVEQGKKVVAWQEVQEASDLPCDTGSDLKRIKVEFKDLPVDLGIVEDGWHIKVQHSDPALRLQRPAIDVLVLTELIPTGWRMR
jgi:hypothetical protein